MNSPRPSRPQRVLTVESTEQVAPHVVRVWLTDSSQGDASLAEFPDNGLTDSYVKLVFVDPELGLEPPYDLDGLRATLPKVQLPVTRTYTIRSVDRAARRLSIDFVTHGDTGLAAPWAMAAQPGDRISFHGPGGGYAPDGEVPWHAFVGDLSALPAISVALEALPATASGVALIEIHDEGDVIEMPVPAGVEVRWLVNPDSSDIDFLARAVDAVAWPADAAEPGRVQVFAHGERESIKSIRAVLRDRAIPRESLSISGYWARGRTEDVFQAEKREPIGQID